jgi:uncharacterized protein DUF4372
MFVGKMVFAQTMDFLPLHTLRRCAERYAGRYPILAFSCLDQYLCMAFAQLTCHRRQVDGPSGQASCRIDLFLAEIRHEAGTGLD